MTGHFASYRGGSRHRQVELPVRGRCLVVVIDASTLVATDVTMHDEDDTGLLAQLGPVATLTLTATAADAAHFYPGRRQGAR